MATPLARDNPDIVDQIPDPETVSRMLAESIRRADLLRSLLRVARRKAAYRSVSPRSVPGGVGRKGVDRG
jgi:hypothetical protein